ncbi:MAG: DoxX family protein [Solirubrobacterales bacterium]
MAKDRSLAPRVGTALLFLGSGIMHFTHEKFYTAIVPKSLPNPQALVQISGVAEIAGAVGVLIPGTRKLAGKGLIALLIAVFPANINMALNPERFKQFPAWSLWARLPLQFAAIALVWRGSQRSAE